MRIKFLKELEIEDSLNRTHIFRKNNVYKVHNLPFDRKGIHNLKGHSFRRVKIDHIDLNRIPKDYYIEVKQKTIYSEIEEKILKLNLLLQYGNSI